MASIREAFTAGAPDAASAVHRAYTEEAVKEAALQGQACRRDREARARRETGEVKK